MGATDGAGEELSPAVSVREEKIFVSVRLRPLSEREIARKDASDWDCISDNTVFFKNSNLPVPERSMYPTAYTFDRVFRSNSSTKQVYEEGAKDIALSVVNGINSSVFAYGQTSSGKTYTMTGITEYTIADIYDYIQKRTEREFTLKFSALEIYNESVRDLLSTDSTPLRLLDDPERGTIVEKLIEETLRDWNHVMELLSICEAQRQIGETSLNETSSRSHQIIRLTVESSAREFLLKDNSSSLAASVNFVDLAGSERASQLLSAGMRLKEGSHINRSLLTLGTVIRKLSKGRNGHVPFRDSKLTRILQSSLGGNARTAIICTMSPARSHVEQSRNTLLFASCAKEVTTNAQVNVVMSDKALVKHLQRELSRLENELNSPKANATSGCTALLREKDLRIEKLEKDVVNLTLQRDVAQSQIQDLLRLVGDDGDSIASVEINRYPSLRVQKSPESDRTALSDSHSTDVCIRAFDTSKYSGEHSRTSSDDHCLQLPDHEQNFLHSDTSTRPLTGSSDFTGNDSPHRWGKVEENINGDAEDICKEVRCIEIGVSNTTRNVESKRLAPEDDAGNSASMVVGNGNRNQELMSPDSPLPKEDREESRLHPSFVVPSPEKPSSWLQRSDTFESRSLLTKSRSCRASLMIDVSSPWFKRLEENENTPANGLEIDFIGRPEGFQRKASALNYGADVKASQSSVGTTTTADELQAQNGKNSTDENSTSINTSVAETKEIAEDQHDKQVSGSLVHQTEPEDNMVSKNVKDVGLDPMEDDDSISLSDWPSEFKRLQSAIIELWHTCNVSLVHRTYLFLLFKGDPADSIYMQVELRRLSFLMDSFSKGNQTVESGRTLTPASSMKGLRREREKLSKAMERRLSQHERESLYIKWGIGLNTKNRRLQLANRLWTKTEDMDHIGDSAIVVAKVVGFIEPVQGSKESFGSFGLNFTPQRKKRRSYSMKSKSSVISLSLF
ncbi:kinesin-like protein KIN-7F [Cornus florida]|uniref:kinesin-like protein KIN-7F n=1 Tax=Cornus florida TaxID=4283 RepID=UPI0028970527|nr:kinesin-like protein KIN-7F [Cornus florida]XP_059623527.1 kinesin-like protein KIN-7F [Cornus florida]